MQGFTAAYESLLEQREEILLGQEGILSRLSGSHIRTVLLATRVYGELLANIVHPDYLINGLAIDRFTSVLWRRRAGQIEEAAQQAELEIKQIMQGDVPHFSAEVSSVAIVDQSGAVAAHADKSATQRAMDRIKRMGKADLERQTWYIRASVATLTMGHVAQMGMTVGSGVYLPGHSSGENTSDAENMADRLVRLIADHLLRISFSGEGSDWMGLESDDDVHWRVSPSGLDAYSGSTGVGLFYLYAGDQLNSSQYTQIAQRMVDARARMVEGYTRPDVPVLGRDVDVGLFSVMGAASYFLAHAACRSGQERARLAVDQMVSFFERAPIRDENIDIVMGSAGLITALLSCEEALADGRSIELAVRYADHLLGQATQMGNGRVAWYAGNEIRPLTGYSHGAAGIAAALSRLSAVARTTRYDDAIMGAFSYERSTKDPSELYWPDLRSNTNGRMAAWCHGAPGIGLARAQVLRARPDLATADMTADIESVWQQMQEWQLEQVSYPGQALSDSLCHGTIGNILCLRTMVPFVDGDASRLSSLTGHFHDTVSRMSRAGVVCGVPEGIETPGLMNGLAGVGLGILAYDRWQDGVVPTAIGGETPTHK